MKAKKKLALSFSGGIDSSFSIFILLKKKFYIETIFMKNWEDFENKNCAFKIDLIYVKNLCKNLKIKLHILDYSKIYWNLVFLDFLNSLKKGLTPNPDVYCNRKIKFKIFYYYVIFILKFDFLLTGHYSGILNKKKIFIFLISKDRKKDQTYFIFNVEKKIKKQIVFPVVNYLKTSIKILIQNFNFLNFNKKSSVGICFIGEKNFKSFIKKYIKKNIGYVFDEFEKKLMLHDGIFFYTIGEHFSILEKFNKYYVFKKNLNKNLIYVTKNKKLLYIKHILIKNLNFKIKKTKNIYLTKIRHSNDFFLSLIYWNKTLKKYSVFFKSQQKIISAGQYVVFYKNNRCIGGAEILKIIK